MGTIFLTNLAAVAGKYERYDVLSAILDFETHNRLPLKKLRLLKTLKKTLVFVNCPYSHQPLQNMNELFWPNLLKMYWK